MVDNREKDSYFHTIRDLSYSVYLPVLKEDLDSTNPNWLKRLEQDNWKMFFNDK